MSFYVACECGRAFEVEEGHAAPTARCPDCGRDVAVAAPPPPAGAQAPVETVEAERTNGREPDPTPDAGPGGFGPEIRIGGRPGQVDFRTSGTGCLILVALIVALSIAVPQFGAAVASVILGCCVLPLCVAGIALWWRMRQIRKMLDPDRRDPGAPLR
ncbi:MAG: hypothetical protein ACYTGX_00895 [Planctomycetota bacterium]|jgi:DNA-directed RNA polymerase subunit RPC12/RpoP